jgi:hypothetical protein
MYVAENPQVLTCVTSDISPEAQMDSSRGYQAVASMKKRRPTGKSAKKQWLAKHANDDSDEDDGESGKKKKPRRGGGFMVLDEYLASKMEDGETAKFHGNLTQCLTVMGESARSLANSSRLDALGKACQEKIKLLAELCPKFNLQYYNFICKQSLQELESELAGITVPVICSIARSLYEVEQEIAALTLPTVAPTMPPVAPTVPTVSYVSSPALLAFANVYHSFVKVLFVPGDRRKRTPLPNVGKVVTSLESDDDDDDDPVVRCGVPQAATQGSGMKSDDDSFVPGGGLNLAKPESPPPAGGRLILSLLEEQADDEEADDDNDDNSHKLDVFGDSDDDCNSRDDRAGGDREKSVDYRVSLEPSNRILLANLDGKEMAKTFVQRFCSNFGPVKRIFVQKNQGVADFVKLEDAVAAVKMDIDGLGIGFMHFDIPKGGMNDEAIGGEQKSSGNIDDLADDNPAGGQKKSVGDGYDDNLAGGKNDDTVGVSVGGQKSSQGDCSDDNAAGGKKGGGNKSDDVAVGKNDEAVVPATFTSKDPLDVDDMAVGKKDEAVVAAASSSKDPSDVLLVRPVEGRVFAMTADFVKTAFAQICPSKELKVTLLSDKAALAQFRTVRQAMTAQTTDGHMLRVTFYHGEEVNSAKGGTPKRKSPPQKSSSGKSPQGPRYKLVPRAPTRTSPRRKNNVTADNVTAV